jgi:pimeloyl-ACP methyl ester carboxylesterase
MRTISGGVALSLLFALGACASEESDDPDESMVVSPAMARDRPAGTLTWQPCGNIECATLVVPIDYDNPSLGTVSLALNRARADASLGYHGTVLINPGGPGASGINFLVSSAPALRGLFPGFDFVGFDPRGIGASQGLECDFFADALPALVEEGSAGYLREVTEASRRCEAQEGPLFDHMGTQQVVADIDRMREALGEEEINFFGISYGTRLGEHYALTYPEHTRALVLDSPMSPVPDLRLLTESQFAALLRLQQSFFDDCAAGVLDCPPEPEAVFESIRQAEEREPLVQVAFANWKFLLGSSPGRELAALSLRVQAGLEAPPEAMAAMQATAAVVPTFNPAANLSTNCADDTSPVLSAAAADDLILSYAERSPAFVLDSLAAVTCSGWEVPRQPLPSIEFEPRVPPLVIGGIRDILTPYDLAEATVGMLKGSALLTSEHYGHSAISLGSLCVFGHLRRYLETLELPPVGARCEAPPPQ